MRAANMGMRHVLPSQNNGFTCSCNNKKPGPTTPLPGETSTQLGSKSRGELTTAAEVVEKEGGQGFDEMEVSEGQAEPPLAEEKEERKKLMKDHDFDDGEPVFESEDKSGLKNRKMSLEEEREDLEEEKALSFDDLEEKEKGLSFDDLEKKALSFDDLEEKTVCGDREGSEDLSTSTSDVGTLLEVTVDIPPGRLSKENADEDEPDFCPHKSTDFETMTKNVGENLEILTDEEEENNSIVKESNNSHEVEMLVPEISVQSVMHHHNDHSGCVKKGISELDISDITEGEEDEEDEDEERSRSPSPARSPQPPPVVVHDKYVEALVAGHGRRNNSSMSKNTEFHESGIGAESVASSFDEQVVRMCNSPGRNSNCFTDGETEVDEEDTSMATTVTTTASEMDASFMLSRSLALTEDEFSYTESFKQLKPFNFDHVDPIPEGKRERLYKVLVVGELGTGKTSIIKRYVHQFFSQHYRATIGVDFALKVLRWDPETVVRLQLWDIAGQERFGSMTRVYYKEAVGAFVVFDVTRSATLEAVPKWKADLDTKVVLPDGRPIPTVLLANKSDQPKEGIAASREKMNEFCQQQGFSAWFETSAKESINIDESANFLVSKILDMDKWSQEPMSSDPEKLDLGNGKHKAVGSSNCSC